MRSSEPGYDYRVCRADAGWQWSVAAKDGAVVSQGSASTRAEAAAFVIRAIVRGMAPEIAVTACTHLRAA